MPWFAVIALIAAAAPVPAAEPPRIVVMGHGAIRTDPDVASLTFTIRGEGATSDAAAQELVRKRRAITAGLAQLLGDDVAVNTGELSIKEARDKACDRDDDQPRLSTGACAVRGYVASVDASLRISPLKDAGTALSLASRLGGADARLGDFTLRDPGDARRRAEAAAMADAHDRAQGIAAASRSRLGGLVSVQDEEARENGSDIVVTGYRRAVPAAAVLPPVVIDLKPAPIETAATLTVTYALEP